MVFGFQGHWLAAAIAAVCFASVFAVTLWARQRQTNSGRSFTRSELLGHAGMGLLTLATLTVTAISGDTFLLLLAAASLLTGIGFLVARIRRGEAVTSRDLLDSLL
ncbi:hypothetical protein ACI1US_02460 [Leucobacter sp. BZR 635]